MKNTSTALAVLAGLAGLTIGFGAHLGFGVAAAQAQPAQPAIVRWDYYCLEAQDSSSVTAKLRSAGAQGWELVSNATLFAGGMSTSVQWCFKRPLAAAATPPPPPPPPATR